MNELALFSGIGGGILGGHLLGWRTICAVECEPYPTAVLCARQDEALLPPCPIWSDVRTFDGRPWRGIVDIISGGFPCQDISAAGKCKNQETIDFIFSLNPNIEQADENGYTPIFMADGLMLDELLKRGANVEARNNMEHPPVFIAHGEKLQKLLKHGAHLNVRDDLNETPFIYLATSLAPRPAVILAELELMLE